MDSDAYISQALKLLRGCHANLLRLRSGNEVAYEPQVRVLASDTDICFAAMVLQHFAPAYLLTCACSGHVATAARR